MSTDTDTYATVSESDTVIASVMLVSYGTKSDGALAYVYAGMGAKSGEDSSKSPGPTRVTASLNSTPNWRVSLPVVGVAGLCLVMDVTIGSV